MPKGIYKRTKPSWLKGKHRKTPWMNGPTNPKWKGEQASYRAVHQWIERKLGKPGTCQGCGKTGLSGNKIHWANISGQYLRLLYDWVRLCSTCHKRKDLAEKKYNKEIKKYE